MQARIKLRIRLFLLTGAIVLAGVAILWRPQAVAGGISRGLAICATVLIPSLFPFLVLGGFLTRSGVAAAIGRRAEGVTRRLFGLPGCCAAGILIGAVGGYPAGGVVVGELVRSGRISVGEGRRMLRFCVNGGPGFVISAVGVGLLGNAPLGMLLFAAQLTAAMLIGVVGTPRESRRQKTTLLQGLPRPLPPTAALVESVTAACESLLYMCGFVLLFSSVLALADVSGVTGWLGGGTVSGEAVWSALIACVLEVGCGCAAAVTLPEQALWFVAFAIGFGGLSVQCQLASSLRGLGLIDRTFFAARLIHGMLTVVIARLLLRWIPLPHAVIGMQGRPAVEAFSGSVVLSVALLILGGVWMLTVGRLDKTA